VRRPVALTTLLTHFSVLFADSQQNGFNACIKVVKVQVDAGVKCYQFGTIPGQDMQSKSGSSTSQHRPAWRL